MENSGAVGDKVGGSIIGNTNQDQVIGRLLERTEQLQSRDDELHNTLAALNMTLATFRDAMVEVKQTLVQIDRRTTGLETANHVPELWEKYNVMNLELQEAKTAADDWLSVKKSAIKYAVYLVLGALFTGTIGGQLLAKALEHFQ